MEIREDVIQDMRAWLLDEVPFGTLGTDPYDMTDQTVVDETAEHYKGGIERFELDFR